MDGRSQLNLVGCRRVVRQEPFDLRMRVVQVDHDRHQHVEHEDRNHEPQHDDPDRFRDARPGSGRSTDEGDQRRRPREQPSPSRSPDWRCTRRYPPMADARGKNIRPPQISQRYGPGVPGPIEEPIPQAGQRRQARELLVGERLPDVIHAAAIREAMMDPVVTEVQRLYGCSEGRNASVPTAGSPIAPASGSDDTHRAPRRTAGPVKSPATTEHATRSHSGSAMTAPSMKAPNATPSTTKIAAPMATERRCSDRNSSRLKSIWRDPRVRFSGAS